MLTAEVYRESLLLSHLARSIASEACAATPGCNATWDALGKYNDAATQKLLDDTYKNLTTAIGKDELAQKQLSMLSPWDAAQGAWEVTGTVITEDGTHVVATPTGHDPYVEQYLAQKQKRTATWKILALAVTASAVAITTGVMLGRRSKRAHG